MALVGAEDDLHPITIPEAIDSLNKVIVDVVRKNRTLVDYYIYPKQTPSEIEAYQPRLQVLYARIESLSKLDLRKLALIVDDAAALVSAFLLPIIEQLLNAVHGVQQIFINHYDRGLEHRKPYHTLYSTLEYREKQLKKFQNDQMRSPQRRLPEQMNPIPSRGADPSFCRFAVAFVNHRDHGKLAHVLQEDLTKDEREKLKLHSGAYLSWDCPGCAFKLKYHVASSVAANILATDDLRSHSTAPEVEYRPSWLVKCHLYQTKTTREEDSDRFGDQRRNSTLFETSRRGSTIRRQSTAETSRFSNPFFFGAPRRTVTRSNTTEAVGRDRRASTSYRRKDSNGSAKYGCPFCFATGKEYGHMDYSHGRELAEHIASRHHVERAPSMLLLEKYMVGLNGKSAENVRRWDLNIKSA